MHPLMLKEKAIYFFLPLGEIGFWILMDDKSKCNIIPELGVWCSPGLMPPYSQSCQRWQAAGITPWCCPALRGGCEGEGGTTAAALQWIV